MQYFNKKYQKGYKNNKAAELKREDVLRKELIEKFEEVYNSIEKTKSHYK